MNFYTFRIIHPSGTHEDKTVEAMRMEINPNGDLLLFDSAGQLIYSVATGRWYLAERSPDGAQSV